MGGFTVTIEDLSASAKTFAALHGDALGVLRTTARGLDAAAGMAGDDEVLAEWRRVYDALATLTWAVAATAASTLADVAARLAVTGNNYLDADRASGGDAAPPIPQPAPRGTAPPAPPSSTGRVGLALPRELAEYWPGGDPEILRAAAAAWSDLARALDDSALDADGAFRSLVGANTGATFSAIADYWARHFESCGTEPLFNAAPATARALALSCAQLARIIETTRDLVSRAAAEASDELSYAEIPALLTSRLTFGLSQGIVHIGKLALTTRFLDTYRDYYLGDVHELVDALRQIDQAHLYGLAVPGPPEAAVEVSLDDVGEVITLGLTGSAWDDVAGPHPDAVHLVEERRVHILDSDATGGGHRFGTGRPGKSEFPEIWNDDDRILRAIMTTARAPHSLRQNEEEPGWVAERRVDGILIRVIVDDNGYIRTAHPVEGPGVVRNPP